MPIAPSVPLEMTMGLVAVMLWTESVAFVEWVMVTFGDVSITTSSSDLGRSPVLQFVFVSQSPPAGFVQLTVDISVMSSSDSNVGRYRTRLRDLRRCDSGRVVSSRRWSLRF